MAGLPREQCHRKAIHTKNPSTRQVLLIREADKEHVRRMVGEIRVGAKTNADQLEMIRQRWPRFGPDKTPSFDQKLQKAGRPRPFREEAEVPGGKTAKPQPSG